MAGATGKLPSHQRAERLVELAVLAVAAAIAILGAHPYAGAWNDGSRLATVECVVDYHTLAIDRSIFVNVPVAADAPAATPYPKTEPLLLEKGTQDKLLIDGQYYSDKGPV